MKTKNDVKALQIVGSIIGVVLEKLSDYCQGQPGANIYVVGFMQSIDMEQLAAETRLDA